MVDPCAAFIGRGRRSIPLGQSRRDPVAAAALTTVAGPDRAVDCRGALPDWVLLVWVVAFIATALALRHTVTPAGDCDGRSAH